MPHWGLGTEITETLEEHSGTQLRFVLVPTLSGFPHLTVPFYSCSSCERQSGFVVPALEVCVPCRSQLAGCRKSLDECCVVDKALFTQAYF